MQLRFSHNAIKVRDLAAMLDFYENVLGFQVTDRGPLPRPGSPEIVFLSQVASDHHQLAFVDVPQDSDVPDTLLHMAFRVSSITDVREMIKRLEEDGLATDVETVTHGNAWSVYFRDPEFNRIEVFCDTPWYVPQPIVVPWDPEMSDRELFEHTEKLFSNEPGFGPMEEWTAAQAEKVGEET